MEENGSDNEELQNLDRGPAAVIYIYKGIHISYIYIHMSYVYQDKLPGTSKC